MATEDIGLADPRALSVALAAKEAYHFLGSPEGELAIAEAVVYLATAPKSNRVYEAWGKAVAAAREHPAEPVPLHVRNAPTGLMKELGYGAGYRYDPHEAAGLAAGQEYLPEVLRGARWYEPTDGGFEKTVRERLAWWAEVRRRGRGQSRPSHTLLPVAACAVGATSESCTGCLGDVGKLHSPPRSTHRESLVYVFWSYGLGLCVQAPPGSFAGGRDSP